MTDSDDALRRQLGWTGPEDSNYEPDPRRSDSERPPVAPSAEPAVTDHGQFDAPRFDDGAGPGDSSRTDPSLRPPTNIREAGPPIEPDPVNDGRHEQQQSEYYPPPQPSARDTRQFPSAEPRDSGQWDMQRGRSAPPPPVPHPHMVPGPPPFAGAPGRQWHEGMHPAPRREMPAPPRADMSYADRIRYTELVPQRRVPPSRGWRLLVYKATFGRVNLGQSADERAQSELEAQIRSPLRGNYKIGVLGKGGVGKTTVSASIGSVFAELRQDDRVVAIDADTAFGKLGSRVDPKAAGSYWELASDQHLDTFADIRSRVGNNAAGLFVLAGEASPARRRVLEPAVYREATSRLDRYFNISIVDCSSTMDSPVTQEVMRGLDALIVVSSPWVDGAAAAGQTLDWLAAHGMTELLQRTVVVLNDSDGHADKRTRSILAQQFSGNGQVIIEVPFDGHLRPGGVIDGTAGMSTRTKRRFLEIAAALAQHFVSYEERTRERRS